MKIFLRLGGAALLFGGSARTLVAQAPTTAAITSAAVARAAVIAPACTYATCALRLDRSIWHRRIVRDVTGTPVASLDMPRASELVQLFATSDSASTYAAQYIGAERVSRPLTIAGSALAAIGMLQDKRMNGYTISGLSLVALSIPFVHRQERALRRAIWWYNADLPAVTPDPH